MEPRPELDDESFSQLPPHRLGAATKVVEYVATHPRSTIREIAKGTDMSDAAIRYLLIDLLSIGVIKELSHLDEEGPRRRGRPAQRYIVKKVLLVATPPRRFWQLSDSLIATLLEMQGEAATTRLFRFMGERAAKSTADRWRKHHRIPMSIDSFRRLLSKALNQLGYSAILRKRDGTLYITTRNCIFSEISQKYEGLVCNFHHTYYPTLFSLVCGRTLKSTERSLCMAEGDHQCQMELQLD
jgi:predicted ArsR family transcriptional regulator